MDPAFSVNCLSSHLRLTEIALEVVVALIADLSSGGRAAMLVLIL